MALLDNALAGTSVTVETTLNPGLPWRVNVGETVNSPQGWLTRFLRPRITVLGGAAPLLVVEPAGAPEEGPPYGLILLALGCFLAAVLLLRRR